MLHVPRRGPRYQPDQLDVDKFHEEPTITVHVDPDERQGVAIESRVHIPRLTGESFSWWDGRDWRTCRVPIRLAGGPTWEPGETPILQTLGELDRKTIWGLYRKWDAGVFDVDERRALREALNMWRVSLADSARAAARAERLRKMRGDSPSVEAYRKAELKRLTERRTDGN